MRPSVSSRYAAERAHSDIVIHAIALGSLFPPAPACHVVLAALPQLRRPTGDPIRFAQALQYVAANGVVCPAGWRVLVSLNTVLPVLFPSVKATPAVLRPDTLGPR